ncbi:MAG: radical SAM protein [Actinobacteria bacterium]|nr:MAG: radical SAM protein [Actinomycetota bacterium]
MATQWHSDLEHLLDGATKANVPLNLMLETTYRCNLACRHCYVSDPGGTEMSMAEIRDALEQLAEAGSLFLTLTGGELLVRDDWYEIFRHARELSFVVRLFSNGSLITDRVAERIADLKALEVGVSLYGAKEETHEEVTRVGGSFEATLAGLRALKSAGVKREIKFLLMRHNLGEYQRVRALADELEAEVSFSFYISPRVDGSADSCEMRMSDEDLTKALADGFLYPDTRRERQADRPDLRGPALAGAPMCGAGRDTCAISPYGDIRPCAILPLVAGNFRERRFADVWRDSALLRRLRGAELSRLQGCRDCPSVGYCGRCTAFALLEDGDMFGPSSFACHIEEVAARMESAAQQSGPCDGRR